MRTTLLILLAAFSLAPIAGHSDEVRWNSKEAVRKYHKNSELQRQWAYEAMKELSLGTRESILDYGCGDGKITASLSHHASKAKVVGIDNSPAMIDWASKKYNADQYSNLEFLLTDEEHPVSETYSEVFDLAVSFSVFEQIENPEGALKDIHRALRPGGMLAMVIPGREGAVELTEAFDTVRTRHKLAGAGRPQMQDKSIRDVETARKMFREAGFQMVRLAIRPRMEPFVDKTDFVDWLEATVVPLWNLPEEKGRQLCTEIADEYLKRAPDALHEDGSLVVRMAPLHVLAAKPRMAWVR